MSNADICEHCDRPIATPEIWAHPSGCQCADCEGSCFRSVPTEPQPKPERK